MPDMGMGSLKREAIRYILIFCNVIFLFLQKLCKLPVILARVNIRFLILVERESSSLFSACEQDIEKNSSEVLRSSHYL